MASRLPLILSMPMPMPVPNDKQENSQKIPYNLFEKIPKKYLFPIYTLSIVAQLVPLGIAYNGLITPYASYGGGEGLLYYLATLAIFYVVCARFFYMMIDRCTKILHLALLFLLPQLLIEVGDDFYWKLAPRIDPFFNWYLNYQSGVVSFNQGAYAQAQASFKESVRELDLEKNQERRALYFKSKIYFLKVEVLQAENKQQTFANLLNLWKEYREFDESPSLEQLSLLELIVELHAEVAPNESWRIKIEECFQLIDYLEVARVLVNAKQSMSYYQCTYFRLLYEFMVKGREGSEESIDFAEVKTLFDVVFPYYLLKFPLKSGPQKKSYLYRLLRVLGLLEQYGRMDEALEGYLTLLEVVRAEGGHFPKELKFIYERISLIYSKKDQKIKAEVFLESAKKIQTP
ncbi:MAG: hypothetical protein HQK50_05260 [Oligoflexia bacterium]|nr:hypothetical protein [Oligoflexia bacterium]MBF0364957.1 hypothetical protein [Oligoflexia bacterium]